MTIQWPEDTDSAKARARDSVPLATTELAAHLPLAIEDAGTLPNPRRLRDVLAIVGFIILLFAVGVASAFFGPLPRIFPATPESWFAVHL